MYNHLAGKQPPTLVSHSVSLTIGHQEEYGYDSPHFLFTHNFSHSDNRVDRAAILAPIPAQTLALLADAMEDSSVIRIQEL
jgi:hypothetical protein